MEPIFTANTVILIAFFVAAYVAIIFENFTRVNKAATALLGGVLCWMIYFLRPGGFLSTDLEILGHSLSEISEIIFFLIGAMTIVELIDSHHGFQVIIDLIRTRSKVILLWLIGISTFFVSAVLDNLTATIVMLSLLRKILPNRAERWFFGSIIVLAANAGGAWTPIGDVTTTMLWIRGNLTTFSVITSLFLPSLVTLLVVLSYGSFLYRKKRLPNSFKGERRKPEPGARLTFFVGVAALIFVPIFKALTGLPPYMGMFIGVSILWLATDLWHYGHKDRDHLKIPHALTRIDTSAVLFFAGILLAVGALQAGGVLRELADGIDQHIKSMNVVALIIGIASAIIDNVPLVAASISMYPLSEFPTDSYFWNMVAYCAGTGGSILIIGSAAGVALMSIERVDFFWYMRRITPIAFISYFAGAGVYLLMQLIA